jgi:Holliday junction resolvase RusA-like endonuclease
MSNPFRDWTKAQLDAHNARVAAQKPNATVAWKAENALAETRLSTLTPPRAPTTLRVTIPIDPCPAPRMTRRDKWLKPRRPRVQRYFDYRDALQTAIGDLPTVPDELHATFHFPMPESWPAKKRAAMDGRPHRCRPDGDNCTKAIQDALFLQDGGIWKGTFEKRWAVTGRVEIVMVWCE